MALSLVAINHTLFLLISAPSIHPPIHLLNKYLKPIMSLSLPGCYRYNAKRQITTILVTHKDDRLVEGGARILTNNQIIDGFRP